VAGQGGGGPGGLHLDKQGLSEISPQSGGHLESLCRTRGVLLQRKNSKTGEPGELKGKENKAWTGSEV